MRVGLFARCLVGAVSVGSEPATCSTFYKVEPLACVPFNEAHDDGEAQVVAARYPPLWLRLSIDLGLRLSLATVLSLGCCMPRDSIAPLKLKSLLKKGDKYARYQDIAAWVYRDPSIVAAVLAVIGEHDYDVVEPSVESVRQSVQASLLWQEATRKAVVPATDSAEGEVDPEQVAPYYDPLRCLYARLIEAEFQARTGVALVDVWDTSGVILGLKPINEFLDSLHVDDEDQMWSYDTVRDIFDVLYEPFFGPAKAADFYSRNRLAIRSLVLRTETQTLFGVRNVQEIDLALHKFIEQKRPGFVLSEALLYLHDTDTERSEAPTSGQDFEIRCAEIIRSAGHKVEVTQASSDKGVDLLVETADYRIAVQCKFLNKPAGIKAVQEIVAGAKHYKADYGMVVCDAGFTQAAEDLAVSNGVVLANTKAILRLDALF